MNRKYILLPLPLPVPVLCNIGSRVCVCVRKTKSVDSKTATLINVMMAMLKTIMILIMRITFLCSVRFAFNVRSFFSLFVCVSVCK